MRGGLVVSAFFDFSPLFYLLVASGCCAILGATILSVAEKESVRLRGAGKLLAVCGLPSAVVVATLQAKESSQKLPAEMEALKGRPVVEAKAAPARPAPTPGIVPAINTSMAPQTTVASAPKGASRPEKPAVAAAAQPAPRTVTAPPAKAPARRDPRQEMTIASLEPHPATRVYAYSDASAKAPTEREPRSAGNTESLLALGIKAELKRLNCYAGKQDGAWGKDVVVAVSRFNAYAHRSVSDAPDSETLTVLKEFSVPVCP